MKKTTTMFALLLTFSGFHVAAIAAETPENLGPEIVKLKMGSTSLDFKHRKHQLAANNECFHCHKPQEWKIKVWDKEVAHIVCIACHDLNDNGPVECKGCHTGKS